MGLLKQIAKNSFFVLTARLSEVFFNLLVFAIIARYLGIEGFGRYSFVLAAIWVLSPLMFLGLNQIIAREVALDLKKSSSAIVNGMILNLIMVLPVMICSLVIIHLFKMDKIETAALFITIATFLPRSFLRNFFGVFIAHEKMEYLALTTFIPRGVELILISAVIFFDFGYFNIFVASCIAEIIGMIACWIIFKKKFSFFYPKIETKEIWILFKESLPLMFSLFLIQAFLYVGIFVLKSMTGNTDVGLFQGPHKILTRLQILPMTLLIPMLPLYSRLAASRETLESFNALFEKTLKWILIFVLPITIIGIVSSERIILLLFGREFYRAGSALQILLLTFPFLCLTTLQRYLLIALKRQKLIIVSDSLCVIFTLLTDVILVPLFGFIGASIGTVVGIAIQCGITSIFFIEHLKALAWQKAVLAPAGAAIVLTLSIFGLGKPDSLMLLPVHLFLYSISLFFFKALSREDIHYFRERRTMDSYLLKKTHKEEIIL